MNEKSKWQKAQEWEREWHGNCVNTLGEELKQLVYAEKMGLQLSPDNKSPYRFDLEGKSVLDIGSGPASLLLKCFNFKKAVAIDPMEMPVWVKERYKSAGIDFIQSKGEDLNLIKMINPYFDISPYGTPFALSLERFDECWLYNCLEHTEDPKRIIDNAKKVGKIIRVFEWINTIPNIGHPNSFTKEQLDEWFGGEGKVEQVSRGGAVGSAYYGVFLGI